MATGLTRIAVAEDQRILREGLCSLLNSIDGFKVIAEAADGLDAVKCVEKSKPDIVLLDLSMPRLSGLSAMREINRVSPQTKILALTIHDTEEHIYEAFDSGAHGYCLKDSAKDELIMAIRTVLAGKPYISPGIAGRVLEGYLSDRKEKTSDPIWESISPREKEILKFVGEGYQNKEIADYLSISVKTVERHRANIMQKLDLHSASALTAYAIKKGLVTRRP